MAQPMLPQNLDELGDVRGEKGWTAHRLLPSSVLSKAFEADPALKCRLCSEPAEPAMRLAGAGFECESQHSLCKSCALQQHPARGAVKCPACQCSGRGYVANPQVDARLGAMHVECHCGARVALAKARCHLQLHANADEVEKTSKDLEALQQELDTASQQTEALRAALLDQSATAKRMWEESETAVAAAASLQPPLRRARADAPHAAQSEVSG